MWIKIIHSHYLSPQLTLGSVTTPTDAVVCASLVTSFFLQIIPFRMWFSFPIVHAHGQQDCTTSFHSHSNHLMHPREERSIIGPLAKWFAQKINSWPSTLFHLKETMYFEMLEHSSFELLLKQLNIKLFFYSSFAINEHHRIRSIEKKSLLCHTISFVRSLCLQIVLLQKIQVDGCGYFLINIF